MPDHILDIHLDFDTLRLALTRDATRTVYEASRKAAEDEANKTGRTLRHPDPRATVIKHAEDPATGRDVLLVGTRWIAD